VLLVSAASGKLLALCMSGWLARKTVGVCKQEQADAACEKQTKAMQQKGQLNRQRSQCTAIEAAIAALTGSVW
jgi:hypothetical protein